MSRWKAVELASPMLVLALVTFAASPAFSQSKTGTAIGQFLRIEPSARHAGMGNAGTAVVRGIEAVYFNPGAIGLLDRPSVQITRSDWFAGIRFDYAAGAFPLRKWGNLFFSVTSLNSGEIDVRTVDQPLGTGERFTVEDIAVSAGYGRNITERLSAGVQVTYAEETIWHSSTGFVTFNVGTAFKLSQDGIVLGSALSNLGTRARYDGSDLAILYDQDPTISGDNPALPAEYFTEDFPVPILFRVGLGVPRQLDSSNRLLFSVDALHPANNDASVNTGVEWSWRDIFALRAGYQTLFQAESELGLTFGTGVATEIHTWPFALDYSWSDHDHLDGTHRITLVAGF